MKQMSDSQVIKGMRIRIYLGEASHFHHQALYHAIVLKAREVGMAGATVFRAFEGFGPSSRIHSSNLLDLSSDLPMVIEIIDNESKVEKFLEIVSPMLDHGMITTDPVTIFQYGHPSKKLE